MRLIISTFIIVFLAATPAAAQLSLDTYQWQGKCLDASQTPLDVSLTITTNVLAMNLSGKMNGQNLSAIKYDRTSGIVLFDVEGALPVARLSHHFSGTFKFNENIEGVLHNLSDASVSKCTLSYVEASGPVVLDEKQP